MSPEEQPFLDEIRANPDDDAARLVYADWLEERGDVRAEYLRVEVEYQDARRRLWRSRQVQKRLHEIRQSIGLDWLAVVARTRIENCCDRRCPEFWAALTSTNSCTIRSCGECGGNVYYCDSILLAQQMKRMDRPITIDPSLKRRNNDLQFNGPMSHVGVRAVPGAISNPDDERLKIASEEYRAQLEKLFRDMNSAQESPESDSTAI